MTKKPKVKKLFRKSYLAFIKNCVGSKAFRNFYALVDGKKTDVAKNGELSCAYFVSAVLTIFDLIERIHLTVEKTIKDLKKSDWQEIEKPKVGSVLVWERGKHGHKHIGFYLGEDKAVSHREEKRVPVVHDWTYDGQRKIEKIFWSKKITTSS